KAIRKILPYLMKGEMYSDACLLAGFRHSESLTKEENANRQLNTHLEQIQKGDLRQPIVEKILNQMVNLVNALVDKHGQFDEIVVELARELQSSREERSDSTKRINDNEKKNKEIAERIKEYGLTPTRSRILKYKLWEETDHKCIYCGAPVGVKEFLQGFDVEVEHIVPRSVLFDDSFANKACSCRACNLAKGNRLARTYMESKGEEAFNEYVIRINELKNSHKISNTKFTHLMWKDDELPTDFIERQLRESQFISKKAMEMLRTICHTVRATSGSVTDYLRHEWGWDQILHNLNIDRYRLTGLTEFVEIEHRDSTVTKERIVGWSKRLDHRHHAIDALTIACTCQSVIQRLNTLNSLKDVKFKPFIEQSDQHKDKQSQLQQYVQSLPHFTYNEAVEAVKTILVSMKPVSKLTTPGKRFGTKGGKRIVMQEGIVVPRGRLHEETIYGKIKVRDAKGKEHEEVIVKYPLESISKPKEIDSIVDNHIRELVRARFVECGNNPKLAFSTPLYSDKAQTKRIKTVRCFTGLSNALPVKYDDNNNAIGFANPGNNYYIGIYEDENGELHEHVATFIHCVERKRYGIPPIINDANEVWDTLLQKKDEYPESFLNQLPNPNWKLKYSMQRNEMFILGMPEDDYQNAIQ
ncbi:MAG: HNH endonuclease, partial [Bacteroidaceae bacterium]|nr:HNH endonuclease [Bacteroidaceae bacterium]